MGGCRGNAQVKVGQIAQTTLVTAGDFKGHPDERPTTMMLEQDAGVCRHSEATDSQAVVAVVAEIPQHNSFYAG